MDKINEILNNKIFKENYRILESLERDREFCNHGIEHSLSLGRIAYIKVLEEGLSFSKEVIYGTALLHDLGRVLQYKEGISHEEGSIILANDILKDTSFTKEEKDLILIGIKGHRGEGLEDSFSNLIRECDKLSRSCFNCKVSKDCYWNEEKKNNLIKY